MARKRLLYIAPNHLDFYKVILYGLEKYSEYEVTLLLSTYKYQYKNVWEKISNAFMKFFFNKNLKKIKFEEYYTKELQKLEKFDVLVINRADIFPPEMLQRITQKAAYTIATYWDSFEKIKGQKETIPFFDSCFSFDLKDCEEYNLKHCSNFYYVTEAPNHPEYDVFYLATYDNRFKELQKIVAKLKLQNLKISAKILSKDAKVIQKNTTEEISFFSETIPFPDSYIYNQNTKVILDIAHDNQIGLSFRPFEAMGLRKKLITTNQHIATYDFYNPDNIFIWKEDTQKLPEAFLNSLYTEIPDEIFKKYSLEYWVKSILPN